MALAGQKVFLENFAFRAQRGKRAGEQRREEVGAQSQACCWLVGEGLGSVAVVGSGARRLRQRGTGLEKAWGTGARTGLSLRTPGRLSSTKPCTGRRGSRDLLSGTSTRHW